MVSSSVMWLVVEQVYNHGSTGLKVAVPCMAGKEFLQTQQTVGPPSG